MTAEFEIARNVHGLSEEQIRDLAARIYLAITAAEEAARLAERERCAQIADGYANVCEAAAAIRAAKEKVTT